MMMEIIGFIVNNILFFFDNGLGGGDGSKPSVSFLNPLSLRSQKLLTRTFTVLVFSPRRLLSGL